jgi:hypothetical protein
MEKAFGKDDVNVGALIPMKDVLRYKTRWAIEKFKGDFKTREEAVKAKAELIEKLEIDGNLLLNEGINSIWTLVCSGATATVLVFNNTNSYIGVGDSATAAAATDTGLLGTNKLYKAMDADYPTFGTNQQAVFRSTFGSADANFAWNEITVADGNSDSSMNLNRKVQAMGTKASGKVSGKTMMPHNYMGSDVNDNAILNLCFLPCD